MNYKTILPLFAALVIGACATSEPQTGSNTNNISGNCREVPCTLACNEFQTDEDGCAICACEEPDSCEPVLCTLACDEFETDGDGCAICACKQTEPVCPDPNDPAVHYAYEDPLKCSVSLIHCEDDQVFFSGELTGWPDECGCGCIDQCPGTTCPDPDDPAVHYVSQDPLECAAALIQCEDDQVFFSGELTGWPDECGCGCIDT
jgi:hypothetical protein